MIKSSGHGVKENSTHSPGKILHQIFYQITFNPAPLKFQASCEIVWKLYGSNKLQLEERALKLAQGWHISPTCFPLERKDGRKIQQHFPFIQAECNTSCVENSKAADYTAATELDWLIASWVGWVKIQTVKNSTSPLGWKFEHVQRYWPII